MKKSSLEPKVQSSGMYIDGEWVHSKTEEKIEVVNPATERVIGRVPRANREEVKGALEAARDAQPKWEDTPPIKRASFLFKIAQLTRRDKERLAGVLTAEQGKPLFESRLEIEGSAENFEYYAEYARRIQGDVLPSDNPRQSIMILKLPLGVVASITPWNFPSAMAARKIAPAL
ncbi:aldehyde dehydrogenase family protein, partial [Candidatus Bathyarchaeota archaeon]